MARDTLPRFGIQATPVDTSALDEIRGAIQPNTKMIWVETPSNPLLRITDIAASNARTPGECFCNSGISGESPACEPGSLSWVADAPAT